MQLYCTNVKTEEPVPNLFTVDTKRGNFVKCLVMSHLCS